MDHTDVAQPLFLSYDLTQFRLIGQKELVKTAITLENSMCIAVLSCLKQDTPWTKRVGKICGNG